MVHTPKQIDHHSSSLNFEYVQPVHSRLVSRKRPAIRLNKMKAKLNLAIQIQFISESILMCDNLFSCSLLCIGRDRHTKSVSGNYAVQFHKRKNRY